MPRPKSDLAPRILEAARNRFLLEGVDGASLRQIASDAGTNIGMIYYYYPTKDDLFLAVVESVYEPFLVELESQLVTDVPVEARIRRLYARLAAMSDAEFATVRLMVREALISSDRMRNVANRVVVGHLPKLLATLAEGRGDGTLDPNLPIPAEVAATMMLAIFPQIMLRVVRAADLPVAPLLPDATTASQIMASVLLHGIGAKDPPGGA